MRALLGPVLRVLHGPRLAAVALLALMAVLRLADPLPVQIARLQVFDLYQRLAPRQYSPLPVLIVDIDEASLTEFGQWPWPRTMIGDLITALSTRGAVVIGFDVIFAEEDRLSPDRVARDNTALPAAIREQLAALPSNDDLLAEAIRSARVVLGESSVRLASDAPRSSEKPSDTPHAAIGPDPRQFLQHFPALVRNLPQLEAVASGLGVFSLSPDADGIYRRVPLAMIVGDAMRLALSAEALRIATGGEAFGIRTNDAGIDGLVIGRKLIRTDGNARVWPYFSRSEPQRYLPAGAVLNGSAPPERIANRIVLVGTSAIGLEDYRATPLGIPMPGVEIHAQIIESILTDSLLRRPNYALGMELSFLLIAGLGIILIIPRLGATRSLALAAGFVALFAGGSAYAFLQHRLLIDATFPISATTLLFIALATANYMREERQRQQIRGAFSQYISPDLVEELIAHPERMRLGGETKELTLLFSDVRGFTALSEEHIDNPQGLTQLMNDFLTELSAPILEHNGTIDKYMGDAIMAFWNAPLDRPDHALAACKAALAMLERLDLLNARRRELAQARPIRIGIGINTGLCVVGNMGSAMRFDYTALGDTVNTASRLEGQSKAFGLPIVIGEATAQAVTGKMAVLEIDLLRVKGKKRAQHVHALIGDESRISDPSFCHLSSLNLEMITAYRTRNWDAAENALARLQEQDSAPGIDLSQYIALYTARIGRMRLHPPPPDWDGSHEAETK